MTQATRISHHPDVVFTDLGDEGVIMHAISGEAFRLNASGVLLWRSCPADTSVLADALVQTWQIPDSQAAADVATWLSALSARGLIISEVQAR